MKKISTLLLLSLTLLCGVSVKAYGGERKFTDNGISYEIIDDSTCKVTYTGTWYFSRSSYSGDIVLPSFASDGKKTYKVTKLGAGAFYESDVTSVTLPPTVNEFESNVFSRCYSLKKIILPQGVKYQGNMGGCLFWGDRNLKEIEFPEGISEITAEALNQCIGLKKITIPSSVKRIGWDEGGKEGWKKGFVFNQCYNVDILICKAITPPTFVGENFNGFNMNCVLMVPAGSVEDYKSADGWKKFTNVQIIPDQGSSLKEVVLPSNGVYIFDKYGAFTSYSSWNTSRNDDVIGIALITDHTKAIIAKEDASSSLVVWGADGFVTGVAKNSPNYSNSNPGEAVNDYAGAKNTCLINSALSSLKNTAVSLAAAYTFPNGEIGYLPSLGEMNDLYSNLPEINAALSKVGTPLAKDSYWTSTMQYLDYRAWAVDLKNGNPFAHLRNEKSNLADVYGPATLHVRSFGEIPEYLFINSGASTGVEYHQITGGKLKKEIYDTNGIRLQEMRKGINIIRYSDGTTRKIFVK